jgi:hypothetical protein
VAVYCDVSTGECWRGGEVVGGVDLVGVDFPHPLARYVARMLGVGPENVDVEMVLVRDRSVLLWSGSEQYPRVIDVLSADVAHDAMPAVVEELLRECGIHAEGLQWWSPADPSPGYPSWRAVTRVTITE